MSTELEEGVVATISPLPGKRWGDEPFATLRERLDQAANAASAKASPDGVFARMHPDTWNLIKVNAWVLETDVAAVCNSGQATDRIAFVSGQTPFAKNDERCKTPSENPHLH
jgi:hypothetical protein